ncbi:MAG: hypothetical protein MZW92_55965 [Comamonadaceae bacterium]|nr:hypothetical protein [Comamonadaceae bacterium]
MNRADVLARRLARRIAGSASRWHCRRWRCAAGRPARARRPHRRDRRPASRCYDDEQGAWVDAVVNRPLTTRRPRLHRRATAAPSLRVGSTDAAPGRRHRARSAAARRPACLAAAARRQSGAARARGEVAAETEVVTAEARLQPRRAGHYRRRPRRRRQRRRRLARRAATPNCRG